MSVTDYQQVLARLLSSLSFDVDDLPGKVGIRFEPDIIVNVEMVSLQQSEQIVLSAEVGAITDFGTFFQVCTSVAKGNYYWSKTDGYTLSVHEDTQKVYAQYAFPLTLLKDDAGVTDIKIQEFEKALLNVVEFIKYTRDKGFN